MVVEFVLYFRCSFGLLPSFPPPRPEEGLVSLTGWSPLCSHTPAAHLLIKAGSKALYSSTLAAGLFFSLLVVV